AERYARRLGLRFALASNGRAYILLDTETGAFEERPAPPTPAELLGLAGRDPLPDAWRRVLEVAPYVDQVSQKQLRPTSAAPSRRPSPPPPAATAASSSSWRPAPARRSPSSSSSGSSSRPASSTATASSSSPTATASRARPTAPSQPSPRPTASSSTRGPSR